MSIQEPVAILAIDVRDARRHVVHDQAQLGFRRPQRFLRLLQAVDVVHQDERARHLAGRRRIGNDADRHPARNAERPRDQPVEFGRLAVERPGDLRLRAFVDARTDDVGQPQRRHLACREPEVLQQRPVDVLATLGAIDVGHRRRHAVHHRPQLAFPRRQRVLRALEVGDVVEDDVDALDRAVDPVVRHHPSAHPPRPARRVDDRPFVDDGLARERPVLVRREPRGRLETDHVRRGLADDRCAVEAVQLQERIVDERVAVLRVEVDDGVRYVVGEQPELLFTGRERLLGPLEVVDVVLGAVESAQPAVGVEVRRDPAVHPALRAPGLLVEPLVFDVLARVRALEDRPQKRRDVRRQHLERRAAVDLLLRQAHPVRERLIDEGVGGQTVEVRDRTGNVVREQPQLHFLRPQRIANRDVVVDVGHHREDAVDAPRHRPVGEQRDANPAQLARRLALAPLERDLRPAEGPVDVLVHVGEGAAGDQLLHAASEQIVGRHADPVAERLVREPQLQVAVEMDDRRAHAVGDQPQPVLAPARLELQPFQLIDVGVADEESANVAVCAAVRVVVDVDPDRGPSRHRQLPLEPGALAGKRRVDIGFVQRKRFPPVDVLDLLADHIDEDLAGPLEEGLVDEAVAPLAVHIGQRQADRVQLPLGQRSQIGGAGPAAGLALDRAEPEPGKGLRQRHAMPIPRGRRTPGRSPRDGRSLVPRGGMRLGRTK